MQRKTLPIIWLDRLDGTPAVVNRKTGQRYIDKRVYESLPDEHRVFVRLHELGHYAGSTKNELYADKFAFNQYAREGFPLTGAVTALSRVLSFTKPGHIVRLREMYKNALEYDANVNKYKPAIKEYRTMNTKKMNRPVEFLEKEESPIGFLNDDHSSLFGKSKKNAPGKAKSRISSRRDERKERKEEKRDMKTAKKQSKIDKKVAKTSVIDAKAQAKLLKAEGKKMKGEAKLTASEAKTILAEQGITEPTAVEKVMKEAVGMIQGGEQAIQEVVDQGPVSKGDNEEGAEPKKILGMSVKTVVIGGIVLVVIIIGVVVFIIKRKKK